MKHTFFLLSFLGGLLYASSAFAQVDSFRDANGQMIYKYVERMPQFLGNVHRYLSKHIKYPRAASDSNIQGRVLVHFIIDPTGKVDSVTVKESAHPLLDAEAVRVVSSMPRWIPGATKVGRRWKKVKVYYTFPISFTIK